MDPDAALRELRELHVSGSPEDFERAVELIIGLDGWLLKGGVPPKDWQEAFGPVEVRGQLIGR